MLVTFGEAKTALAQFVGKAGKCPDDAEVAVFVKKVIQTLLFRGASGNLRKWVFWTQNGCFTAPSDLEIPIKFRIDSESYGSAAYVYDKFYEFYDQSTLSDCKPCEKGIVEEPNQVFTQFSIPPKGARILAVPFCKEEEGAKITIRGRNIHGREIQMPVACEDEVVTNGEAITLSKEKNRFSKNTFCEITGIDKPQTRGYVHLYWYDPECGERGLLAEYKPLETRPHFRRFRVVGLDCERCYKVTILGRIRFCSNYHDSDVIPISHLRALELMAQQMQDEDGDNLQAASYKNKRVDQALEHENQYKRTPQASIDFLHVTSPGAIENII